MVQSFSDYGWEMIMWGADHTKMILLIEKILDYNMWTWSDVGSEKKVIKYEWWKFWKIRTGYLDSYG